MPENKNNLFTRLSLGATMAEAPAVMTAAGWTSDPVNGVQVGDPNAPGNEELRRALVDIGVNGLTDLAFELAIPPFARWWNSQRIKLKDVPNLVRSRKYMRTLNRALDDASTSVQAEQALTQGGGRG